MNNREKVVGGAAELAQIISLYGALEYRQLLELHPDRSENTRNQISWLIKNNRVYRDNEVVKARPDLAPDPAMIAAFWVLLDFYRTGQVEYHTKSDFPAIIYFFVGGENYDIIVMPPGSESLICHALRYGPQDVAKHIIVLDNAEQLQNCPLPGAPVYCTVSATGQIDYFKKKGSENA